MPYHDIDKKISSLKKQLQGKQNELKQAEKQRIIANQWLEQAEPLYTQYLKVKEKVHKLPIEEQEIFAEFLESYASQYSNFKEANNLIAQITQELLQSIEALEIALTIKASQRASLDSLCPAAPVPDSKSNVVLGTPPLETRSENPNRDDRQTLGRK